MSSNRTPMSIKNKKDQFIRDLESIEITTIEVSYFQWLCVFIDVTIIKKLYNLRKAMNEIILKKEIPYVSIS